MIKIGNTTLPLPSDYKVTRADIDSDSTHRTEAGYLKRDRVRSGVYNVDVSWRVSGAQYKTITDALSPASFSVTFFDPNSATTKTCTMYASDRTGQLVNYLGTGKTAMWDLSVTLVEY